MHVIAKVTGVGESCCFQRLTGIESNISPRHGLLLFARVLDLQVLLSYFRFFSSLTRLGKEGHRTE